MQNVFGFLGEILSSAAVVVVLIAIAAHLGKSQIAQWLNKDIEKLKADFQKELEGKKASYQRELELYKVSLIAESERARALQSVRTAVAVKFSEHQFTALSAINAAYANFGQQTLSLYELSRDTIFDRSDEKKQHLEQMRTEFKERSDALTAAIFSGNLFMHEDDVNELHDYDSFLSGVAYCAAQRRSAALAQTAVMPGTVGGIEFDTLPDADTRILYMRQRELRVTQVLRKYANDLLSMQAVERQANT
jgi:hypothetical protein